MKTQDEIEVMRSGGHLLSQILGELVGMVKPGISTLEIDRYAIMRMEEVGGSPSFRGYKSAGDTRPFPSAVCTSVNEEVVHAPAEPERILEEGDLFKMDIGMWYGELCTDMAVTVPVGTVAKEHLKLMRATKESLMIGIEKVVTGGWVSDVGKAVDKFVRRQGYSTVKDLVGHGVGRHVHEDPRIPNFFDPSLEPIRFEEGMTVAIEPMVNAGTDTIALLPDEWTVVTADGARSAHFEVTLGLTAEGTIVLTPLPENV